MLALNKLRAQLRANAQHNQNDGKTLSFNKFNIIFNIDIFEINLNCKHLILYFMICFSEFLENKNFLQY